MKLKHILLGLCALILIVAVLTNPAKENHIDYFFEKVIDKEKFANGTVFDFITLKIVKGTFEEITTYRNFVLFSVCEVSNNEKTSRVTIGLFGNIFLLANETDLANLFNFNSGKKSEKDKIIIEESNHDRVNSEKTSYSRSNEFSENDSPEEEVISPPPVEGSSNTESNYPRYLVKLEKYSPNSTLICQDQSYSECLKYALDFVKVLSEIRRAHLDKKNNDKYLEFYRTEKAILSKRSWNKDAITIDTFIYNYIEMYENNLKECDCEDLDWLKKLPKDLYQHFYLDRGEIMNSVVK